MAAVAPVTPAFGADCYSRTGCVETARSAASFRDSAGINTHLGYTDTIYGQRYEDIIRPRLLELGVSHIRDGTFPAHGPSGPTIAARYRGLGLGLNLLVGLEQGASSALQARLDWIKANDLTPQVIGIEGSNESWDDAAAIRNLQCDVHRRVKNDPALASKPVIGPSAGPPFSTTVWYDRIGDLSGCLDRGNLHPYPGEDPPHLHQGRDLSVAMDWGRRTYGSKPYWVTENGYWTKSPDGSHVSEQAAGVYIPRIYMENFRRGLERTQAYELIDLNTATNDVIHNYGLLRTDGSEKPAYTKVKNLLALTKDTREASGSLGFGIVCTASCHSPIRHVLMRHSDGSYLLAMWSESRVWDGNGDTPRAAQSVDLVLHEAPERVDVFSVTGSSPIASSTSGAKTIATAATDDVRIVKITPAQATPQPEPAPTAMSFEAEGMQITPWFPSVYPEPGVVQADATASAGKRLMMRHYGQAGRSINTTSTASRLTIRAFADQCVVAPQMTVKLDGTTVGSRAVSATSWTDYTFEVSAPAGQHEVVVTYDNDYEDASCNRNLYLDSATFSFEAPPTTVEAEGTSVLQAYSWSDPHPGVLQDDSTASGGRRLMLWTYGTASKSLTTKHAYGRVVVRARGDQCAGAPEAWVKIDGKVVAKHVVDATSSWASYPAPVSLPAGAHTIAVQYPYDHEQTGCNRNLYLDRVVLEAG